MKDLSFQSTSARIYISDDDWRFENHGRTDKIDVETRAEILQIEEDALLI